MKIKMWLASSMVRHFPDTPAPTRKAGVRIDAALNERFSFQLVLRNPELEPVQVRIEAEKASWAAVRVRKVGYVPVRHRNTMTPDAETDHPQNFPGYVPDPLFEETELLLPPGETHAFWVSVVPGRGAQSGVHYLRLRVFCKDGKAPQTLTARVELHNVRLKPRRDFPVTNWFYNDALLDFHNCDAFGERYWQVLPNYLRNLVEHGQDTLYVPVFTPPLDGVKRPTQLLHVQLDGRGKYRFDWRHVRRYLALARKAGIKRFEWTHLFSQWGVRCAIRIYEGIGADKKLLWSPDLPALSETYRAFLAQFLPEFHKFLREQKVLGASFFHVSDEPHGDEALENYRSARALLRELAPWMKCMDALSDIRFGREGLTDVSVPSIRTALDFVREDIACWCYYCCGPRGRYVQRLLDTPLPKIRMNGWLFYRWGFGGFLHWGYNYWYLHHKTEMADPFTEQSAAFWPEWPYGDCFMVYPGKDGPLDSIRWEVFAESLQDYALLQGCGVERGGRLLSELRSFEDFPKSEEWVRRNRRKLLQKAARNAR